MNAADAIIVPQRVSIPARDGFALGATVFHAPAATAAPTAIIAGATAIKRGFYSPFADFLARRGFNVVTFDYRGVGESRPKRLRGFHAAMHQWGELDLAGVIDWTRAELATRRLYLVGHSVAGQIFPLADNREHIDAVYLVASQSGYWGHWDGAERIKLLFAWHVAFPLACRVCGYFPGWLVGNAADLPAGVAREWARWGRRADYILTHRPDLRERFAALRIPLRMAHFTDDPAFGPPRAVQALLEWYRSADKTATLFHPRDVGVKAIGHFGFFREEFEDTLWRDALEWLRHRETAAP